MAIENLQDLCEALRQRRTARETSLVQGTLPEPSEDTLKELDDADFLSGSTERIDNMLANPEGSAAEQVTALEENAFLAAAQNAYGLQMRDQMQRRLDRQRQLQKLSEKGGVIDGQLKLIGVLADPPAKLQSKSPDTE